MFESIIQRAQAGINRSLDQVLGKVVAVVPFIIAFGFAIAALASWLYREIGFEAGNLVLAAIFTVIGLIAYAYTSMSGPEDLVADEAPAELPLASEAPAQTSNAWSDTEKEMAAALLTTAAPAAVPVLLRLIMRNLPLVLAILAAAFVMTRPTESQAEPSMDGGVEA